MTKNMNAKNNHLFCDKWIIINIHVCCVIVIVNNYGSFEVKVWKCIILPPLKMALEFDIIIFDQISGERKQNNDNY